jgi:glycosyltransferase involved in cell wall biosynthesis
VTPGRSVLLDISRLISAARRRVPSGIERVELAYARHFLADERNLACALAEPWKRMALVDRDRAVLFVETLSAAWAGDAAQAPAAFRLARIIQVQLSLKRSASLTLRTRDLQVPLFYLLVSHHHLDRPSAIGALLARTGARLVAFVHDMIPVTHPEYARPGIPEIHRARMQTVAALASGVIYNSAHTQLEFSPLLERVNRAPAQIVAPLGLDVPRRAPAATDGVPYFVFLSTIEPRKNHLLLLNLWRELAQEMGPATPRLTIIGRRGWENENVIDMIERCEPIRGVIEEINELGDSDLGATLAGARALVLPSFAEGFGLPVAEALAAGTPVLCSDLPALREVGGDVPEYLHPLDGPAWRDAILDYAGRDTSRRDDQLRRLEGWSPPTWTEHFTAVEKILTAILGDRPPA